MKHNISKTPLIILFLVSMLPILFIYGVPQIWAFIDVIAFSFMSLWAHSVIKILLRKNSFDQKIKYRNFTVILFLTTVYIIALSTYFALTFTKYENPKWFPLIIIIGQFLLFRGIFYLTTFIAKTLSTLENKRIVKFSDYAHYVLMLVFFPIGIWWLYPRIHRLVKS